MADFDLIVIGTGAGGGTLIHELASKGKRILIIERGHFLPREKENWETKAVFLDNRYTTDEIWKDKNGKEFRPGMHYYVGGNTKFYGAALLRLRERDFEEVKHYGGVSPAWPLPYEEFQPFYLKAEQLFKVHGNRGDDPTEPYEKNPYPFKALSHEPRIQRIFEGMQKKGLSPFPLPLGLQFDEKNREHSPCIRCDTCDGFPCLVHGKSDAEVCCIRPALKFPNVTLLTGRTATRLKTDPSGEKVVQVEVEKDGEKEFYSAPLFVLSCGAINSAALLLKSASEKHPNGLANSSDLVGRNYMCHINTAMVALHKSLNTSIYEKTFGLNDFYFNAPDWEFPLGHIQLLGNVKKEMLQQDAPKFTPGWVLEKMARHAVGWWICSEDLPSLENRVLVKDGTIYLHYTPNNEEGHRRLIKKTKEILNSLEMGLYFTKRMPIGAVAHQVGTCRFGKDPKKSVLDLDCKTHDLDNLYVVDGSFFPSIGAVNPALTIIANALRVSELLSKRL